MLINLHTLKIQKFTYTWFLILCHYLNDPQLFLCLVIVLSHITDNQFPWLSWAAGSTIYLHLKCFGKCSPEKFNCLLFFRKILQVLQILWFSIIFCIFGPCPTMTYDFEIHLFTPRKTEGLIHNYYKGENIHWCSRRNNTLGAGDVNF